MRLSYTRPALQRLLEIEDYVAVHSSERAARKVVDDLLKKAHGLLQHPRKGRIDPRLAHRGHGHRRLVVGRYLIIYFIEADVIHITDFFDTKQHPSRMRG